MNKQFTLLCATVAIAQSSVAGEADAFQEPLAPVQDTSDSWNYRVSLYAPLLGLDGTSGIGPISLPIDLPFSDIAENLDGAFIIAAEAQKGKFSIIGDFLWLKLSNSSTPPTPGPGSSYLGLKVQQIVGNLALGYQLYESPKWTIDALAGAAYTGLKIDADLTIFPPGPGPQNTRSFGNDESWVDPFLGVRLRYRPSEKWRLFGRVDYGGWGVGSDTYFQTIVGGGYQINDSFGIYAAYRYLSIDYSKNAFSYDVDTSGPQIGVVFAF
jgi:hypothetical protein